MTNDELDRVLASYDDIVPSSGFARAVMNAIGQERWQRPPLQFPWRRIAIGPLVAILLLVVGLVRSSGSATVRSAFIGDVAQAEMWRAISDVVTRLHLEWAAVSMLLTVASLSLSSHLAARVEREI